MKKSTFAAILVFFAFVAGALAAVYFYLRRRESELDEYEQLLFSEDFSHEEDSTVSDEVDAAFAEAEADPAEAETAEAEAAEVEAAEEPADPANKDEGNSEAK